MRDDEEKKRERGREKYYQTALSLYNISEPQYLLSLYCYACWVKCTHIQSNTIESLSTRNKVLHLQQCYWKFKKRCLCEKINTFHVNKWWRLLPAFTVCGVILALLKPYCYKLFRHVNSSQDQVCFHFLTRFLTSMCSVDLCLPAHQSSV